MKRISINPMGEWLEVTDDDYQAYLDGKIDFLELQGKYMSKDEKE